MEVVTSRGTIIGERETQKNMIRLYRLESLFVEQSYNPSSIKITRIKVVDKQVVEKYYSELAGGR